MKKSLRISAIIVTLICALICLCSCSNYNAILRAFEKEGFTESDTVESYQDQFHDMLYGSEEDGETDVNKIHIHVLYKGSGLLKSVAVIAEFESSKALQEKYEESADLQNLVKDLQSSDYVNGTCVLLLNIDLLGADILEIFKNA